MSIHHFRVCHSGCQENRSAIASFAACRRRHERLTLPSRKGAQTDTQSRTDAEIQKVKKTKMKMQTDCQKKCRDVNMLERSRHFEKITCKRRHEQRVWHEGQKVFVKFGIQPMNRIHSCSRQRTLSGMHFSRMPLLAELATRNPKASRGALKCQKNMSIQ